MLTENIKSNIKTHALKYKDKEVCGFLYFDKLKKEVSTFPAINKSSRPNVHFSIDPVSYLEVNNLGDILAVYHSHPVKVSEFSLLDKINAENQKIKSILYCTPEDEFYEYEPKGYKPSYFGRQFELGKTDCYSIIKEYYKQELNIELPEIHRNYNWETENPNLYDSTYPKWSFVKIMDGPIKETNDIKKNDLIFFKRIDKKHTFHAAIYLGDGNMLHHPIDNYSRIEEYDKLHKRLTNYIIRHKNLIS